MLPFDEPPPEQPKTKPLTCRTCIHRERHEMGGSIISYCAIRKSKRTQNGQLKITVKTPACAGFEREKMFNEERAVLQTWEQQFQEKIAELEAENQRLREQVLRITNLLDLPLQKQRILTAAYLLEWSALKDENQRLKDENRWTPVEERLPTSDGNKDVILVNAEGYRWQTVVWFENARFVLQSGEEVEFWSERRPEPYQENV